MRPALSCRDASVLISAELESTLPPRERKQLQAHLRRCPSCRALQRQLQLLRESALQGPSAHPMATPQ